MKRSTYRRSSQAIDLKVVSLVLSAAGALLAAAPAHAAYEIIDNAGVAICCLATYDPTAVNVAAAGHLDTDIFAFVSHSPNYDPAYGATVGLSTTNPAGLASGSVLAFFPGLTGKYPYLKGANGSAFASSDLATGQLHALANSEQGDLTTIINPPGAPPWQTIVTDYYSIATADARFSTDFHVSNTSGADVFLPVSWTVHGALGGAGIAPIQASSFLGMTADFSNGRGPSLGIMDYNVDPNTGQILTNSCTSYLTAGANFANLCSSPLFNFTVTDLGGDSRLMSGLFDIQPGLGVGSLQALTTLVCWKGTTCDYSHTSSLSFGALPAGVSISFDAPGFLGGYGSPNGGVPGVPEPGAWAMMLAGLGAMGAALRKLRVASLAG